MFAESDEVNGSFWNMTINVYKKIPLLSLFKLNCKLIDYVIFKEHIPAIFQKYSNICLFCMRYTLIIRFIKLNFNEQENHKNIPIIRRNH